MRFNLHHRFAELVGATLFFLILFVPTSYRPIKGGLLATVLLFIALRTLLKGRLSLHPSIFYWTIFIVFASLFFMTLGAARGAPGALRVGTVYVLWPLVYTVLVAGISDEGVLKSLLKVMVVATISIGAYGLIYIFYMSGMLPTYLYVPLDLGQAIGFYEGFMEVKIYSISSLLFLVPFVFTALIFWNKKDNEPVGRLLLWLALIAGLLLAFLSGRRVLWLIVLLTPLIIFSFRLFIRKPQIKNFRYSKRVSLSVIAVAIGTYAYLKHVYGLDIFVVGSEFLKGFDFTHDFSASLRKEQFFALLRGWADSPLFGAGHGARAIGSLRSVEMPWAYELSYVALLFHTGFVGFLVYASGIVWIYYMAVKIIRSGDRIGVYLLPVMVGLSCFLIGNATNPYLEKFDYIWVIFLPVAFINYWFLKKNAQIYSQP